MPNLYTVMIQYKTCLNTDTDIMTVTTDIMFNNFLTFLLFHGFPLVQ